MTKTMTFKLVSVARSSGGDRYENGQKGDPDWMVVYFPQSISRTNGNPATTKNEIKDTLFDLRLVS